MSRRVLALAVSLFVAGCVVPPPASPPPRDAPGPVDRTQDARPPRTADRPGFPLPQRVEVVLSAVERADTIEWTDGARRTWTATARSGGVSVEGKSPVLQHRAPGISTIGGRVYVGELVVVPHPQRGLRAIVRVPLEDYVEGVVASELSIWSANAAELEAQAIAARTFAAATVEQRRRAGLAPLLTDGVLDQAFRGRFVPGSSSGSRAAGQRLSKAVRATRGLVLARGDRFEEARYHAACGGHTAGFADVFRREVRERGAVGPSGVPCRPCYDRARAESDRRAPDPDRPLGWIEEIGANTLTRLGRTFELGGAPARIVPARIDDGGRWLDVALYDAAGRSRRVEFDDFRRAIGYSELKSGVIAASAPRAGAPLSGGPLRLQGRGRGHGVGMCQEGMRDHARAGWTSRQILAHYYPGARLERGTPAAESAASR